VDADWELGQNELKSGPDPWNDVVRPILREIGHTALVERTGYSRSSVQDNLRDVRWPRPRRRAVYTSVAAEEATRRLQAWNIRTAGLGRFVAMDRYLAERDRRTGGVRRCESCDAELALTRSDTRFCSDRCRQAARRRKNRATT
jgi:hypothetical protein